MSTLGDALSLGGAGGRAVRRAPSTPHQRLYIRTLMTQLDLDTRYMSAFHRRFFAAAKLPEPAPNASIDAVLCGLSTREASALIAALVDEVPHEE